MGVKTYNFRKGFYYSAGISVPGMNVSFRFLNLGSESNLFDSLPSSAFFVLKSFSEFCSLSKTSEAEGSGQIISFEVLIFRRGKQGNPL